MTGIQLDNLMRTDNKDFIILIRTIFILTIILFSIDSYGQQQKRTETQNQASIQNILNTFSLPTGWSIDLKEDTSSLPLIERQQIASLTFYQSNRTCNVKFYIYKYSKDDSAYFHQKINEYYMLSSCLLVRSDKTNENFDSFTKSNYYFLMKMCPCDTDDNENAKQLAKQLFDWIRQ